LVFINFAAIEHVPASTTRRGWRWASLIEGYVVALSGGLCGCGFRAAVDDPAAILSADRERPELLWEAIEHPVSRRHRHLTALTARLEAFVRHTNVFAGELPSRARVYEGRRPEVR
jgi:hypothetical protein